MKKNSMLNVRRCFLLTLLIAVVLAPITVYAGGMSKEEATAPEFKISAPGQFPIVEEMFTLKAIAIIAPIVPDISTNWSIKWFEDKTNVRIEWDTITQGPAAGDRINLILSAARDLPDVLINTEMTNDQQFLYGSQGILVPLNDLIEKHSIEIKRIFSDHPYVRQQLTQADGNIYGLATNPVAFHSTLSQKFWINREWLNRVGVDIPTTTEEMYKVLKAFKDQDANGNGNPSDEIPYSGTRSAARGRPGAFFMNAFIYDDGFGDTQNSNRLVLENGRIFPAYTQPAWREGLRYNHRLYTDGLFDPEAFVQDSSQLRTLTQISPTVARVGSFQMMHVNWATPFGGELEKQYEAVPPLMGPQGVRTTAYYPLNLRGSKFSITSAADEVTRIIALKYMDLAHELESGKESGHMVHFFGQMGVDWRWAEPGEMAYTGEPALWKQIVPGTVAQENNKYHGHFYPRFTPPGFFDRQVFISDNPFEVESRLYRESLKYDPFKPAEVVPPLNYTLAEAQEWAELRAQINTYVEESFARFVTGDMNIERDWDRYLAEFKSLGLDRYIEIMQTAYNRQYGK